MSVAVGEGGGGRHSVAPLGGGRGTWSAGERVRGGREVKGRKDRPRFEAWWGQKRSKRGEYCA
jgi:hypothetical protein